MTGVRLLKKYLKGVKGKDGPAKGRQIKCGVAFLLERGEDGLYHKVPDSSVHGKGDAASESFRILRRKLKRYGVNCVIRHFECLDASKAKRKGINERIHYFLSHRERMQYHLYRREGWPIGSGEVEGACRSLIKQRTDLSGQRWSPVGALNVLWVRALIKDGLHDQYWDTHRNRSRSRTAA